MTAGETLLTERERLDLLLDLLRQDRQVHDISRLRSTLLGNLLALEGLLVAASRRQVLPVVLNVLGDRGILPIGLSGRSNEGSLIANLRDAQQHFLKRRDLLSAALHEIIAVLNSRDIEPLILKGSMSLITGYPEWRYQRDIDVAIDPDQAGKVICALQDQGFRVCEGANARPHHLPALERPGLPATVELHVKLAGARGGSVLPDEILLATTKPQTWKGLDVRRLSDAGFVLHGLAHHHFQNRGYLFGTFSLKGLIEFAFSLNQLDEAGVDQCLDIVRELPRLRAGFQLWCALAQTVLGMKLSKKLQPDAATASIASATAERFVAGRTAWPVTAALEQMGMIARLSSRGRFSSAFIHPLMEAGHTAVWFDHENQRRNASGVLQEC